MFVLRCTQRLLARTKASVEPKPPISDTRLGDWYANVVHVGRQQLMLAISEKTLLPVVIPVAPLPTLVSRLSAGLAIVLDELGIRKTEIELEVGRMNAVTVGKTASRGVTGIMVDFARLIPFFITDGAPLHELSMKLAHTPCRPLSKTTTRPDSATIALFTGPSLTIVR
jgi:hypothetical protein